MGGELDRGEEGGRRHRKGGKERGRREEGERRERGGELNRRLVAADSVQSEVRNSSCSGGRSNGCHGNEVVVVIR